MKCPVFVVLIPRYLLCFLRKEYRGSGLLVVVLVYQALGRKVFPVPLYEMTSYASIVLAVGVMPSCRDHRRRQYGGRLL